MKSHRNIMRPPSRDAVSPDNKVKKEVSDPFFKSKNKALPELLQANLESSFNQDFSLVDIEKDSQQALELNSLAFTQGERTHFAPGQYDPGSEKGKGIIGHEFAHIVQQRSGAVEPTSIMGKGISLNEDKNLELEADITGTKAVAGHTVSPYRSVGLGMRNSMGMVQAGKNVIQMSKHPSHYGDWFDDTYALTASGTRRGVDMKMRFKPNANVDAELIGLTQSVQALHHGTPFYPNSDPFYLGRAISSGDAITNPSTGFTDEGTRIDRLKDKISPVYASQNTTSAGTPATNLQNPAMGGNGQYGYRYSSGATLNEQEAKLKDGPSIGSVDVSKNSTQVFETSALALKGGTGRHLFRFRKVGMENRCSGRTYYRSFYCIIPRGPQLNIYESCPGMEYFQIFGRKRYH